MKKIISRIKDWLDDVLRGICGPMTPDKRVITIVILVAVFAVVNFYITFKAIYNIGREDAGHDVIEIIPRDSLELLDENVKPLQQEMEEFFNNQFNSEKNDTTTQE